MAENIGLVPKLLQERQIVGGRKKMNYFDWMNIWMNYLIGQKLIGLR